MTDASLLRRDFPQFNRNINGKPIVYLDSAATSLKPHAVINKENDYYTRYTANIFRGIYTTSEEATKEYEDARMKVAQFIGATKAEEVIFTRNTTESINLVCYSLIHGDEVVTSVMEHHSNFVPWQQRGKLKIWYCDKSGLLNLNDLDTLITRRTKLLAITAVSNVLGTINPIEKIVKRVKKINPQCLVLVDAAQSVPHMPIDVVKWGADFVAFSGHKMLGPTGIGILWGRKELLESMKPFNFGGDMIKEVHEDSTVFNDLPHKFEAGTPHIAGAIGLGAAVDYLSRLGMESVCAHEKEITSYALDVLSSIKNITIIGPKNPEVRAGVIAFTVAGIHPHDVAQILDEDNVCIRVGFHCAQPLHEYLKTGPTARASFYVYTTREDIDALGTGLEKVIRIFK
ncbi:MAG: SufS family cysteine desulfurase [Candidatus Gottesmanbacteria bacterium]|nr:SufS family cysteine desulfurase [Candidatus Gottesmanbacteria bacterium]